MYLEEALPRQPTSIRRPATAMTCRGERVAATWQSCRPSEHETTRGQVQVTQKIKPDLPPRVRESKHTLGIQVCKSYLLWDLKYVTKGIYPKRTLYLGILWTLMLPSSARSRFFPKPAPALPAKLLYTDDDRNPARPHVTALPSYTATTPDLLVLVVQCHAGLLSSTVVYNGP